MARTFKLEIVTPEKVVFSQEVASLVIPAEEGYLGVLGGHAPLLCTLRPGEIRIRREGSETIFSTSGGFVEVTPSKASVLSESAEPVSDIDVGRAEKSKGRALERLKKGESKDLDRGRAQAALERAENRLRVARRFGGK